MNEKEQRYDSLRRAGRARSRKVMPTVATTNIIMFECTPITSIQRCSFFFIDNNVTKKLNLFCVVRR